MNSKNMHYCYNVEYFHNMQLGNAANHNNYIYDLPFQDNTYQKLLAEEEGLQENRKSFRLTTVYPGLLIGTGYPHNGLNGANNAIKIGFFFDYVTGIPVIPGSSLKGVLRSYFPELQKAGEKREARKKMLAEMTKLNLTEEEEWQKLEKNLFEEKDVFLGGFPVIPGNVGTKLLDSENITPHKDQFKNPNPLSLLKVRPDVTFEFLFLLNNYVAADGTTIMSAEDKKNLYEKLLLLGGIGAKTNVGFGQFK